jgi:hypothetical protein
LAAAVRVGGVIVVVAAGNREERERAKNGSEEGAVRAWQAACRDARRTERRAPPRPECAEARPAYSRKPLHAA